jgi:hypothetical protein
MKLVHHRNDPVVGGEDFDRLVWNLVEWWSTKESKVSALKLEVHFV